MKKYTILLSRTQYATIEVVAENEVDALEKADDYYDDHFDEVDQNFDSQDTEYEKMILQ